MGRNRKLTAEQEAEIRVLYTPRAEKWTRGRLAKKYGVSEATIGQIMRGRRKHEYEIRRLCEELGVPYAPP